MRKKERILVILNPASGVVSKDIAASVIFKKLREQFDTVSIINSNSPAHGFGIAKEGMEHFDIITAFGGDGTINSIAAAMVGTEKVLGILPGGSGNGLVRNLDMPLSWRRALDILKFGKDKSFDVGKINDKTFLNVAGVGLDGIIARKINFEAKSRGIAPYLYHGLKGYFETPTFRVKITLDDIEFQDEILLVAFANFKQYGGKAVIAPFAEPADGKLDLCILNKFRLLDASISIPKLFSGHIHELPFYRTYKFEKVTIETMDPDLPLPCTIDGEYGGKELIKYTVEVMPAKIKIRVPAPDTNL